MPVKHPETERKETLQKSVVLKVTQVAWSALKVRPTAAGSLACCRRLYEYDNSSWFMIHASNASDRQFDSNVITIENTTRHR